MKRRDFGKAIAGGVIGAGVAGSVTPWAVSSLRSSAFSIAWRRCSGSIIPFSFEGLVSPSMVTPVLVQTDSFKGKTGNSLSPSDIYFLWLVGNLFVNH